MSDILIKSPSFEMVPCDSCTNEVPLALAHRVTDGKDHNQLACSLRCANDIALKLRLIEVEAQEAHQRLCNVRLAEVYQAIQTVERCGASPELTQAVIELGKRMNELKAAGGELRSENLPAKYNPALDRGK